MSPIIVLDQLRKVFASTVAVDRVSLSIPQGEIFGFLGANGAGKTTTMRMLCGLTRPTDGRGVIDGRDIWRDRYAIRPKFGYVAQKFSLYPDLTVLENLRFFGGAYRVPKSGMERRIARLLQETDLEGKKSARAGSLSGGMKQLLAVACALIHEPLLLFLDEPTSGLDPVHRQQMWDLLYDLSSKGTTIFVTTHYMDEAERCTEVGFLDKGRLLVKNSPQGLKESFTSRLLELEVEPIMPALAALRDAPGVLGVSLRSGRARIYAGDAEALLAQWQAAWPFAGTALLERRWVEPDMEDVFKAYSQGYHAMLRTEAAACA
jgi:ABC-2 type transport system ATP-binding protein